MPEPLSEHDLDEMDRRALVDGGLVPKADPETGARYITHYLADVPRLTAEVRRLRALVDQRPPVGSAPDLEQVVHEPRGAESEDD